MCAGGQCSARGQCLGRALYKLSSPLSRKRAVMGTATVDSGLSRDMGRPLIAASPGTVRKAARAAPGRRTAKQD